PGTGEFQHRLGERQHRELIGVADVHRLLLAGVEQPGYTLYLVAHVAERARLRTVPEDREWLAAQRLHDEVRDHATVRWTHSRSVGVEDPNDAGVDSVGAAIRHRGGLGEALGLVIHRARPGRRDISPVALHLRMHQRVAVHLAGRCEEEPGAVTTRDLERIQGTVRADLERLDRI